MKSVKTRLKAVTILYAEDEVGIRKNIMKTLSYYAKEVYEASNGQEAFDLYEKNKPDIILSDIHMPIMDGIEFIKKVRQTDKNTPVVMITAHTDKKYLLEAVELHMEKYIVKPINTKMLFEVLGKCIDALNINCVINLSCDKNYSYDFDNKKLMYKDEVIVLNKKEVSFVELLINNQNRVVKYEEIQDKVWQDNVMTDSALRSVVLHLRKKLPTNIINNLSGIGYNLV
ncbi:response regulator transcription factor [Arcobacter sp. LA11]|uniref:response regulator transcription factor n=1 Tax=Arcobacter sp. LA11 TaxID=1898176 RepID=UPI000933C513|nr:response regulator [Arcobacter sp. LA11]